MRLTMLLAQLPQRPSDLWSLPKLGYSPQQCLDFDFALVDFWEWYKSKSEEQVQRRQRPSDKLKDGYTWVRKYETVDEVLKLYYAEHREKGPHYQDPAVAAMTESAIRDLADEIMGFGDLTGEDAPDLGDLRS